MDEYIIKDVYVLKSKDGLGYIKDGSNYTNDIMLAKTFSVKSNIKQFLRNYAFTYNNHILLKAKTHYKVELDDNLIVESI